MIPYSLASFGVRANNIDDQALDVEKSQVFVNKDEIMQKILDLPQKQAEEWGVDRKNFQRIKKAIRDALIENMDISLSTAARKRLVDKLN